MALDDTTHRLTLPVTGMTCAGCARRVQGALAAQQGVRAATVNFALESADISYDPAAASPAALIETVREAGFGVRLEEADFAVTGLKCAGCARGLERRLAALPGVASATVNFATETAVLRFPPDATDAASLCAAIVAAGYGARALSDDAPTAAAIVAAEAAVARRERVELAAALLLTMPLVAQMGAMTLGAHWHLPVWVEVALATPVQLWIGRRFYVGAARAIRAGAGNMDVLVALGTTAAFAYSLWLVATLGADAAGRLFFEASAVVVTLVLAGKALESRAKRSAAEALSALMALRPVSARVLRAGSEVEVPVAAVAIGDMVVVRPGERIAVDGRIAKGASHVDESLITGESVPVSRGPGDAAVAGALNGEGLLRIRAERVGRDTTLSRIGRMVAEAQTGRAPVQRLVDRVSAIFAPAVLALAALTFAGWLLAGGGLDQALSASVAVLVVACPCALGLATPTALVAGTGAAAKAGVLIRDISALERARAIDTVVFDKTGTLTEGRPTMADLRAEGDADALLALAAGAQRGSEHPLGRAMVEAAAARGLAAPEPDSFAATPGEGVAATVGAHALRVGREGFVGSPASFELRAEAQAQAEAGRTVVWIGLDGTAAGFAAFEDAARPDAAAAVAELQRRGLHVAMLTGDGRATAARVAGALGVAEVAAEVRPEDKVAAVRRLMADGRRVAMVGDGVNDAPALAAADLGVAMGGGADVARAAAGVVLMRPRPTLVPAALDIATATASVIRQNLAFAFVYNLALLPAAALGALDPALAGAAMAASSLSVVGNALRLKRWRPAGDAAAGAQA
jgi:Cu+-exporting ATPase